MEKGQENDQCITQENGTLFQCRRHACLGFGCGSVKCLLQLLLPDPREVGKQHDEKKLHPMSLLVPPTNRVNSTYLSLVIISRPWTKRPFMIWGPMPLNSDKRPSFSTMYRMTSPKVLKGLPFRPGGGRDCRPTLATIRGCVATVARAFDKAPRTMNYVSRREPPRIPALLTKSLPRLEVVLASEQDILQSLICTVGDGGIDDQNQASLQAAPQAGPAILAVDHLPTRREQSSLLVLRLRLLPGRDDGDWNGEDLSQRTSRSTQAEFDHRPGGLWHAVRGHIHSSDGTVPVKVGKVGRRHTDKRASHPRVQAVDAFPLQDLEDGIQGRFIVVDTFQFLGSVLSLVLDLQFRLDTKIK